jgi:hypothetical protein
MNQITARKISEPIKAASTSLSEMAKESRAGQNIEQPEDRAADQGADQTDAEPCPAAETFPASRHRGCGKRPGYRPNHEPHHDLAECKGHASPLSRCVTVPAFSPEC